MGFILQTLACLSAIASLAYTAALPETHNQLVTRDKPCSSSNYAPVLIIGGKDDKTFCEDFLSSAGEIVSRIDVWSDTTGILGMVFEFTSGRVGQVLGYQSGNRDTLELAPGELITLATLWGDGTADHLGHIYLETDKGQSFESGMAKAPRSYPLNVGNGVLVGAQVNVGDTFINNLAFFFLEPKIDHIEIGNVKFDADPTGTSTNIEPDYLIQDVMGNPTTNEDSVTFSISAAKNVQTSTTWEQSTSGTFGGSISVEIDAEPFGIGAKVSGGVQWSVDHSTSSGGSSSGSLTLTQTVGPITLAPGKGKDCKIFAQSGTGDFPYTSTVTIYLVGGAKINYQEAGSLKQVVYMSVQSSCVDADDPSKWSSTTDNPPKEVIDISRNAAPAKPTPTQGIGSGGDWWMHQD